MQQTFCPTCMAMRSYDTIERQETYPVRGEDVTVDVQLAVCSSCGNEIGMAEFDDAALKAAYTTYRSRHALLQPQQIREIRSHYGLGQKAFARLLGWGDVTLARYETGALQSEAHDAVLRLAKNPENVAHLAARNRDRLTSHQIATLDARLSTLRSQHGASIAGEDTSVWGSSPAASAGPAPHTAGPGIGMPIVPSSSESAQARRLADFLSQQEVASAPRLVGETGEQIALPVSIVLVLRAAAEEMAKGHPVAVLPPSPHGEQTT